jgi:hypothetical protein
MVIASGGVADGDQGLVGGVVNTSRQMGAAFGAALLPAVAVAVNQHGTISAVAGDRAAMLAAAVAAGLAMLVAVGSRAGGGTGAVQMFGRSRLHRNDRWPRRCAADLATDVSAARHGLGQQAMAGSA